MEAAKPAIISLHFECLAKTSSSTKVLQLLKTLLVPALLACFTSASVPFPFEHLSRTVLSALLQACQCLAWAPLICTQSLLCRLQPSTA